MKLSALNKTWVLDLDGTIVKHNGYKIDGHDSFLPGAKEFLEQIDEGDMIIFLTSRDKEYALMTEKFLQDNDVRHDRIIYGVPYGERILINDRKPTGLDMAFAVNTDRDNFEAPKIEIDESL